MGPKDRNTQPRDVKIEGCASALMRRFSSSGKASDVLDSHIPRWTSGGESAKTLLWIGIRSKDDLAVWN
jgi:hypothetical protein